MRGAQGPSLLIEWPASSEPGSLFGYICWFLEQKTARFYSLIAHSHFLLSHPTWSRLQNTVPSLWVGATVLSSFYPVWALTLWSQSCLGELPNAEMRPYSLVCAYWVRTSGDAHPTHFVLSLFMAFIFHRLPGPHSKHCSFLSCVTLNLALSSASPGVLLGSHWYPHPVTSHVWYSLFGCLHKSFHAARIVSSAFCVVWFCNLQKICW